MEGYQRSYSSLNWPPATSLLKVDHSGHACEHLRSEVIQRKSADLCICGRQHEASFQWDKHTCIHRDISGDTEMHRIHDHTRSQLHRHPYNMSINCFQ